MMWERAYKCQIQTWNFLERRQSLVLAPVVSTDRVPAFWRSPTLYLFTSTPQLYDK